MAKEKIAGLMATEIGLDVSKAVQPLSELKAEVKDNRNEWKQLESQMRQSGDALGASKAKYDGLNNTVESQKRLLSQLRQEQSEVNRNTTAGEQTYQKYSQEVTKAERQLSQMTNQLKQAAKAYEFQESGLKQLNATLKVNDELTKQEVNNLNNSKRANDALKTNLAGLSKSYEKQQAIQKIEIENLKKMRSSSDSSADSIEKQRLSVSKATGTLTAYKDKLREAQIAVDKANPYGLSKWTSGLNKVYRAADKTENKLKDTFSNMKNHAMSASIGIGVLGAVAVTGAKKASDLQKIYVENTNLLTTSGEKAAEATRNVTQMQKDAQKYSVEYGVSQKDIANGYQELIKRGYSSAQALAAMKSILQASVATGDDFNDVMHNATATLESFGMKSDSVVGMTKNTKEVVNNMAYAADLTATDFQSMGKAMEYVGATAHTSNVSLAETSAGIGELSNRGLEADKAGTGMRKVINSLSIAINDMGGSSKTTDDKIKSMQANLEKQTLALQQNEEKLQSNTGNRAATQRAIDKQKLSIQQLNEKIADVKSAPKAQDMLTNLGIKKDELVDANGNMKSIATVMGVLNKHTKNMSSVDKNVVFNALFGTTGQQAGIILAENSKQLDELTGKVKKSADGQGYVAELSKKNMKSVKVELEQFKKAGDVAVMMIGKEMLPVLSDAAVGMTKAFNSKEGQQGLKTIAKGVAYIFKKITEGVSFIGSHTGEVKAFAVAFGSIWAINKVGKFLGALKEIKTTMMEIKGMNMLFGSGSKTNVATKTAGSVESVVTSEGTEAAESGLLAKLLGGAKTGATNNLAKLSGGFTRVAGAGSIVGGVIGAGSDILNIQNDKSKTAVGTGVGGAAGSLGGAAAGAAIGTAILPGIGTILGGVAGQALGDSVGKKLGASIQKGLSKSKISVPKISTKTAFSELEKSLKDYYTKKEKTEKKDLDLLHKNGQLSDAEYNKRMKKLEANSKSIDRLANMSGRDQTAIAKYYASEKQKVEEKADNKIASDKKKKNDELSRISRRYGKDSKEFKKAEAKWDKQIEQDKSDKKKQIQTLSLKTATKMTGDEARLHQTLLGQVQLNGNKQVKILSDLNSKKGKLTNKELQDAVNKSQKIYDETTKLAEKKANKLIAEANKEYKGVKDEADKKYKHTVQTAKDQMNDTIAAANREFKGNSEEAKKKRKEVTEQARKQYSDSVDSAEKEKNDTVDKAKKKRDDSTDAAKKQKDEITKHARQERDDVTNAAKDQSHGVVDHAVTEANSSMDAHSKQGSGVEGIWKSIMGFFNGIAKIFGQKPHEVKGSSYNFSKVTATGYAQGGSVKNNEAALIGEEGTEMLYRPGTKQVQLIGQGGAQFMNLQAGDHILNARDTQKLLNGNYGKRLPGFAEGTDSLESFFKSIGDKTSDIWDKATDTASDVLDHIGDPLKKIKDIASKAFNLEGDEKVGTFGIDISKSMVDQGIRYAADALKKIIAGFNDSGKAGGSKGSPSGSGVQRWRDQVKAALKANGLSASDSMIDKVLRQIATESGGNEKVTQPGADPDGDGSGPAIGLMQTKRATFNANKFPGHDDIFNGYDNILAGLNYAKKRYGSDLSFLGQGHGYEYGGIVSNHGLYEIAEGNKPEMVIPLAAEKKSRANQLLADANERINGSQQSKKESSSTNLSTVENGLNQMIGLLGLLLGVNKSQLDALSKTGSKNMQDVYNQMAKDSSIRDYSTI